MGLTLEQLQPLCGTGETIKAPFMRHLGDGQLWTFATNGHAMVGVRGLLAPGGGPDVAAVLEFQVEPVDCSWPALKTFLLSRVVRCSICNGDGGPDCGECGGQGSKECVHCGSSTPCERCAGDGYLNCPACRNAPITDDPVWVFEVSVDREVIHPYIAALEGDRVRVRAESMRIRIDGDGWVVLCMGTRNEGVERFAPTPKETV